MHTPDLVDLPMRHDFESVYFNQHTYDCARLAAGGVEKACRVVLAAKARGALCLVRPPGHHAEPTEAGGFCIFNNVAVAIKALQQQNRKNSDNDPSSSSTDSSSSSSGSSSSGSSSGSSGTALRVAVVDWDVHHGNGTQTAFYDDPSVLTISIHRHDHGTFYPTGPAGSLTQIGIHHGKGYNMNVPWPCAGFGDADYLYVFHTLILPLLSEFGPDLIVVSCGFDAALGDPLGGCRVSPECYGVMTHLLKGAVRAGRVVLALEGGYELDIITRCAEMCARVLIGESPPELPAIRLRRHLHRHAHQLGMHTGSMTEMGWDEDGYSRALLPKRETVKLVEEVKRVMSKYWPVLGQRHLVPLELCRDPSRKDFGDDDEELKRRMEMTRRRKESGWIKVRRGGTDRPLVSVRDVLQVYRRQVLSEMGLFPVHDGIPASTVMAVQDGSASKKGSQVLGMFDPRPIIYDTVSLGNPASVSVAAAASGGFSDGGDGLSTSLIIFVHDTPYIRSNTDPFENLVKVDSSFLVDDTLPLLRFFTSLTRSPTSSPGPSTDKHQSIRVVDVEVPTREPRVFDRRFESVTDVDGGADDSADLMSDDEYHFTCNNDDAIEFRPSQYDYEDVHERRARRQKYLVSVLEGLYRGYVANEAGKRGRNVLVVLSGEIIQVLDDFLVSYSTTLNSSRDVASSLSVAGSESNSIPRHPASSSNTFSHSFKDHSNVHWIIVPGADRDSEPIAANNMIRQRREERRVFEWFCTNVTYFTSLDEDMLDETEPVRDRVVSAGHRATSVATSSLVVESGENGHRGSKRSGSLASRSESVEPPPVKRPRHEPPSATVSPKGMTVSPGYKDNGGRYVVVLEEETTDEDDAYPPMYDHVNNHRKELGDSISNNSISMNSSNSSLVVVNVVKNTQISAGASTGSGAGILADSTSVAAMGMGLPSPAVRVELTIPRRIPLRGSTVPMFKHVSTSASSLVIDSINAQPTLPAPTPSTSLSPSLKNASEKEKVDVKEKSKQVEVTQRLRSRSRSNSREIETDSRPRVPRQQTDVTHIRGLRTYRGTKVLHMRYKGLECLMKERWSEFTQLVQQILSHVKK